MSSTSATTAPVHPSSQLMDSVQSFLNRPHKHLIGGEWVDAASGQTFDVIDPATEQVIAQVARGNEADINSAVQAARQAFESGPWRTKIGPQDRTRLMWKLAELIETHQDELAQLETLDNGKPYMSARYGDIPMAIEMFQYMAGWTTKLEGKTIPIKVPYAPKNQFFAYTVLEPVGVVGQIIPWNFPILMAAWKLAPALAAGCTIVLKPAEETPLTALRLGELIQEAGFPPGVVNIVTGYGEETGAPLAAHPDVDKIAFTGSTEVGRLIVKAAGTSNLKKVTLELGGKSPNIVFADADLKKSIQGAASAIFFNQGQCCTAGSRLFIEKSVYDEVVEGVSNIAQKMTVGSGFDQNSQMGPLVSKTQFDRVTGYINQGKADGAKVCAGGERVGDTGYFVAPTLFTQTSPHMSVESEEIFGPVVTATAFEDPADLITAANNTPYGLAGAVWTQDVSKAHQLAAKIKAGTVWVNCYNVFNAALPFGGYKASGWGREMGFDAVKAYTENKTVTLQL